MSVAARIMNSMSMEGTEVVFTAVAMQMHELHMCHEFLALQPFRQRSARYLPMTLTSVL